MGVFSRMCQQRWGLGWNVWGDTAGEVHSMQLTRVVFHCCHHHDGHRTAASASIAAAAALQSRQQRGPVAASNSMGLGVKQQPGDRLACGTRLQDVFFVSICAG